MFVLFESNPVGFVCLKNNDGLQQSKPIDLKIEKIRSKQCVRSYFVVNFCR